MSGKVKRSVVAAAIVIGVFGLLEGCSQNVSPYSDHDSPISSSDDTQIMVNGFVYETEGVGVPDCSVSSTGRSEENAIVTDDDGKFQTAVIPGKQTFTIVCDEKKYAQVTQEVEIFDDNISLDFLVPRK